MSDIAAWLEKLGLSKYQEVFAENEVDFEVLPKLTEQDLKELAIPLGPRKKLLEAISALGADSDSIAAPKSPPVKSQAERRQLTVMFVDLVGSTALSGKLDPEDLSVIMRRYQNTVAGEINRLEGFVAKFMGDGVLAYFGWPRAHEDEAERAVRAGLAIVNEVARLKTPDDQPLAARIGIATGQVVVGDIIGEGSAQEETVVGETPNLAARLEALAAPGRVVIAESTRQLLGEVFELESLGLKRLKGIAAPVEVFTVIGEQRLESRFQARRSGQLLPLVGREQELALLSKRWRQACSGKGQCVLVGGEAGIGKSRMIQALIDTLACEPYTRLRYQCSPFHINSALHAVIEQLERAAGFNREDTVEQKLDKLEVCLRQGNPDITETAPLVAVLLSLPIDRYPALNLSPEKQKEKTLEALIDQVIGLSQVRPVLMIVEDMHWIDPTFEELLTLTLARIVHAQVLIVLTHRLEYAPPWDEQPHVTALTLNRLGRDAANTLITELTAGKPLPAEVLEQILAKTDGVTLFVEELTKTVLEAGILKDTGDYYELAGPLPPLAIPSTLQDSLMARLDRLSPVKEVAQVAACIGREFSCELLAAVSPLNDTALRDALAALADDELIFAQGSPPLAAYSFKHALVRDTAYSSLLKSRRAAVHGKIAESLQDRFPEVATTQPEIIAHHYTEAGLAKQAIGYWRKAAERAVQRLAHTEAIAHFQRGIDLAGTLPEGPDVAALELGLQVGLGYAFIPSKGWTAPESLRAFTRARALCQQVADDAARFSALWGLFVFNLVQAEAALASDFADQCLALAQRTSSSDMRVEAHVARGMSAHRRGLFTVARIELESAIDLYDPIGHKAHAFVYGQDPKVISLNWLAFVLWALGFPDQALARCAEGKTTAGQLLHPVTQAFAVYGTVMTHLARGEAQSAQLEAEALIALAEDQRMPFWAAIGTACRSLAVLEQGDGSQREIAQLQEVIETMHALGAMEPALRTRPLLVRAHLCLGDTDAAQQVGLESLALTRRHAQGEFESMFLALLGEAHVAHPSADRAQAERFYREAIEVARGQEAKSIELRSAIGLARLWQQENKNREARELLTPIYGWFTEGFDTADLKEAQALLDEL